MDGPRRVIVALIGGELHVRIFNAMVKETYIDRPWSKLIPGHDRDSLKVELEELLESRRLLRDLKEEEKWDILDKARSCTGLVTVQVRAFKGPGDEGLQNLGLRVATVLNLQIWQTLRKMSAANPDLDFGHGVVAWTKDTLPEQSHKTAQELAKEFGHQMVLWGNAWELSDGVAVQTMLTFAESTRLTLWKKLSTKPN